MAEFKREEAMAFVERMDREFECIARDIGLDCYPQEFEWVIQEDMLKLLVRRGKRFGYLHSSYGKEYRRAYMANKYRAAGAMDAHELVYNSDPCVARLVDATALPILIVVIAHVYAHNDFFKNNLSFKDSAARYITRLDEYRQRRVKELMRDPTYGFSRVEEVLDAARTLMFQRIGPFSHNPTYLQYFIENNRIRDSRDRELMEMVDAEADEIRRAALTIKMNEGWAMVKEMEIISRSSLPYRLKDAAINFHADLSAHPHYSPGRLVWRWIRKTHGDVFTFRIRAEFMDKAFFEKFLTRESLLDDQIPLIMKDESGKPKKFNSVSELSEDEWLKFKAAFIGDLWINSIPLVIIKGVEAGTRLILEHDHDGRDLHLGDARRALAQISSVLWNGPMELRTRFKDDSVIISASGNGSAEIRKISASA